MRGYPELPTLMGISVLAAKLEWLGQLLGWPGREGSQQCESHLQLCDAGVSGA